MELCNNIALSKLTNKLKTLTTILDCTSNYIWRYSQIVNLFRPFNSDSPKMPFSKSVTASKKTIQSRCKNFSSSFNFLPSVRPWQYHYTNKQTVNCTCITQYTHTLHCTVRTRAQSIRRQQRKRTSEESEMVTYNHVTEVVRSECVNHHARRMDSGAILILIVTSVGTFIISTIKQKATNVAHQTNKLNK